MNILIFSLALGLAGVSFGMMGYIRDLRTRLNRVEVELDSIREYVDVVRSEINEGNRSNHRVMKELRERVMTLSSEKGE
jgi:predicted DNA-binding ArsR family transcriptional regulator